MRPVAPPREIPPPLELECLKVLWKLGEGNVRQVQTILTEQRTLAYTTVMTVLDRLEKRGAATRRKQGRSFVYAPKIPRAVMRKAAVQRLLADFFDGSPDSLREFLLTPQETPQEKTAPQESSASAG